MADNIVGLAARLCAASRAQLRVRRMTSIMNAIDAGELLAALPDCPIARRAHSEAIGLLNELEFELIGLAEDLDGLEGHSQRFAAVSGDEAYSLE